MPSPKRLLVFDLDGTLADTRADIARSVQATLENAGLPSLPESLVISFVGDGARKLLSRCFWHLGLPEDGHFERAAVFFYEHYHEHVCVRSHLYPGVAETLALLEAPKAVLTNKPSKMARKLLAELNVAAHFSDIVGGDNAAELKPNPLHLNRLIEKHRVSPRETWMIGDSTIDIRTARNAGANSLAVLYGFIPREELLAGNPDCAIEEFPQLPGRIGL